MRHLLRYVKTLRSVRIVVCTPKEFTQNRIIRLFDSFRLDMPPGQIVLQDTNEAFLGIIFLLSSKYKIWMRHEVGYAFQHTAGFEDKCWEGDLGEVHSDSAYDAF